MSDREPGGICLLCDTRASWERHTQFAGTHSFCDRHAGEEEDFGKEDPSYFFWRRAGEYSPALLVSKEDLVVADAVERLEEPRDEAFSRIQDDLYQHTKQYIGKPLTDFNRQALIDTITDHLRQVLPEPEDSVDVTELKVENGQVTLKVEIKLP